MYLVRPQNETCRPYRPSDLLIHDYELYGNLYFKKEHPESILKNVMHISLKISHQ